MRRKKRNWKHSVIFLLIFTCVVVVHHRHTQLTQGRQQLRATLLYPDSLILVDEAVANGQYVATYQTRMAAGIYSPEQVFRSVEDR